MKYRMYLRWLFFTLFSAVAAHAQQPDSLALEQVVQRVLENNPLIEQSIHKIDAAQAQINLSKSTTYPFAAAEVSYDRIGPVPEINLPDAGSFSLFPEDNYDAHVAMQYTVYDYGKRKKQTALAENGMERAQQSTQAIRNNLAYRTVQVFYSILFLQQNINVLDEEISALRSHLNVAQKRADTGSATPFDVLTTRVRVSNAENQRVEIVNVLQKQKLLLKSLMGLEDDQVLQVKGDFTALPIANPEKNSLVTNALDARPEMKLATNSVNHFALATQLAALGNKAQIKVNGVLGIKNGYIPNLNDPKVNWVAGIGLHLPLFDGHATQFKQEQAQAERAAAESYRNEVQRRITTEVSQAVEDVVTQKKKLAAADLQLEQANEAVSLANKQYDAGVVTNLELLDAQTVQAQSKLLKSKVLYNLVLSEYQLERASGLKNW